MYQSFLDRIISLPINPQYSFSASSAINGASVKVQAPPAAPTHFTLTLKPMKGGAQVLKFSVAETVGKVRQQAAQALGVDEVDRVRLIRSGKALLNDAASLQEVFGLATGMQHTLHVLEKPAGASSDAGSTASASSTPSQAAAARLCDAKHPIWVKVDALMYECGEVSDATLRKGLLARMQASLKQ